VKKKCRSRKLDTIRIFGSLIESLITTIKQAGCSSALIDEKSSEAHPRVQMIGLAIEGWLKAWKESGRRGEQKNRAEQLDIIRKLSLTTYVR